MEGGGTSRVSVEREGAMATILVKISRNKDEKAM